MRFDELRAGPPDGMPDGLKFIWIVLLVIGGILAIAWLFLPLLLLSRMNKMLKLLAQIEENTAERARPEPKKKETADV